jgi:hypothetical protein
MCLMLVKWVVNFNGDERDAKRNENHVTYSHTASRLFKNFVLMTKKTSKVDCPKCITKLKVYNRLEVLNIDKADDF